MTTSAESPLLRALLAIEDLEEQLDRALRIKHEPIAIVGLGCRFPLGGEDPFAFYRDLLAGRDGIVPVPEARWDNEAFYDADPEARGKLYLKVAGFTGDVDKFDATFFGISPREAAAMDPQQRIALEVAWQALEHANLVPDALREKAAGVFLGLMTSDYATLQQTRIDLDQQDAYTGTGSGNSFLTGRLSYLLGLQGPSVVVETACSSSLVAIHLACQSLRLGESDVALAGGVNLMLSPETNVVLCRMRALSPDGISRAFDAGANGYGRGEGCGIVVLKRLSDAVADGDRIWALLRGSAVNHDGPSGGLTVPSGPAQEIVLRRALAVARIEPGEVDYVEAHGTGTPLGDPIEIRALDKVYGRDRESKLLVGSVKANIGHLEAAAGIAGLMKIVLAFDGEALPAQAHLGSLNPHVAWDALAVEVVRETRPWKRSERPRFAGISAFGLSGTNAHLVLEEPPLPEATEAAAAPRSAELLVLSAKSEPALRDLARRYAEHLAHTTDSLLDVCHTASVARAHHRFRAGVVADTREAAIERLRALERNEPFQGLSRGEALPITRRIVFLFTGQGSQLPGMGEELYRTSEVFRAALDRCAELLQSHLDVPLLDVLYGARQDRLDETRYTQPALFAVEYALLSLYESLGIVPDAVAGHSIGEIVAAVAAEVLSLEAAITLVAVRACLMDALPDRGVMASVQASLSLVEASLVGEPLVSIAVHNGAEDVVIAGDAAAVSRVTQRLEAAGVKTRRLRVSHAFHSPLMEPITAPLRAHADTAVHGPPKKRWMLNGTADYAATGAVDGAYWARHARGTVRFHESLSRLVADGYRLFVELGPQPILSALGKKLVEGEDAEFLASLRKARPEASWSSILETLGALYTQGRFSGFLALFAGRGARKVALPTYAFQRKRYWLEPSNRVARETDPSLAGTPFLRKLASPLLPGTVFELDESLSAFPDLGDHRIHGRIVVPAGFHLAVVFTALREFHGDTSLGLEDISFPEPLILAEDETRRVHVALLPESTFRLASILDGRVISHAEGRIAVKAASAAPQIASGGAGSVDDPADLFAALTQLGLDLGPSMRWIEDLEEASPVVRARLGTPSRRDKLVVAPGLVDTCFQLLAAGVYRGAGALSIPVHLDAIEFWPHRGTSLVGRALLSSGAAASAKVGGLVGDSEILDADTEQTVLRMRGLTVRRAPRERAGDAARTPLCRVSWEERRAPEPAPPAPRAWIVFGDGNGLTARVAAALRAGGGSVALAANEAELTHLLASLTDASLVHLGALDPIPGWPDGFDIDAAWRRLLLPVLAWLKAISGSTPRTCALITRGAQPTRLTQGVDPFGAMLWGLGHTLALEHPDLRCLRLDLEVELELEQQKRPGLAERIVTELTSREAFTVGAEDQVGFAAGKRWIRRIVPLEDAEIIAGPARLSFSARGELCNLRFEAYPRPLPGPGEIVVEVRAAGLNFRDVLNVLDMYPGDPGPLGLECSGVVVAVGARVDRFRPGDEVMALAPASFASFVVVKADLAARKPAALSFIEAATIPVTFLTALCVLHGQAALKRGDRVLVHAAAGGVGIAAIQLCQRAGAEVLATASPPKWNFVRSLGVSTILSSRSPAGLERAIRAATNGEGVDAVVNSLTGDFISQSLSTLRPGGHFLEIGKTDIWDLPRAAALNPQARYHTFDLAELADRDPATVRDLFDELARAFDAGELRPLPQEVFAVADAERAFRRMSQGKHIGKIVLTVDSTREQSTIAPRPPGAAAIVRAGGAYLLTGGLGALGLATARWLVAEGATRIILTSRRAPSDEAASAIRAMEADGAEVHVVLADVARIEDVARLRSTIAEFGVPLHGIVHAAGVLDDGLLVNLDVERFAHVLDAKVLGAWNLHRAFATAPLDFFVLYSSIASMMGSVGQGNYAAANAFLDALAHDRAASGLPGLSLNWGPWAGAGMAAVLGDRERRRWEEVGIVPLESASALEYLGKALRRSLPQIGVVDMRLPSAATPEARAGDTPLLELLGATPPDGRRALIEDHVVKLARRVVGLRANDFFDVRMPFGDMGFDSLMAVELKNSLSKTLNQKFPTTLLFDYPTAEALGRFLDARLAPPAATPHGATPSAEGAGAPPGRHQNRPASRAESMVEGSLVNEIKDLNEEEVNREIERELRSLMDGL